MSENGRPGQAQPSLAPYQWTQNADLFAEKLPRCAGIRRHTGSFSTAYGTGLKLSGHEMRVHAQPRASRGARGSP